MNRQLLTKALNLSREASSTKEFIGKINYFLDTHLEIHNSRNGRIEKRP